MPDTKKRATTPGPEDLTPERVKEIEELFDGLGLRSDEDRWAMTFRRLLESDDEQVQELRFVPRLSSGSSLT